MMTSRREVLLGVDVGGTHTDAVVMQNGEMLGHCKKQTTDDVMSGVLNAVEGALVSSAGKDWSGQLEVQRVHIGTTQFVNAVVQKKNLARVAVIRLCGPASTQLPPYTDFPPDLKQVLAGPVLMLDGGFHYDGERQLAPVSRTQLEEAICTIRAAGVRDVVVSGVFSPVNNRHEIQVGESLAELYPEASVTLSHSVAQIGLLLRENSAILNQSLKPLARRVIRGFEAAFRARRLSCPIFLTQNDGTLLSAARALEMPVLTFAAGPTNSMRGAAFLSGVGDALVADIGGTSTDVGVLIKGFPRPASAKVQVGGVQTNFQMPDTLSIALGGGSLVARGDGDGQVTVGPESVGYSLCSEALVFGGDTLTATDVAVATGHAQIGTHTESIKGVSPDLVSDAVTCMHAKLEQVVNSVKTSAEEVPLILVGGGSDLIAPSWRMRGVSQVIKPRFYGVANAVGAALSQVAGTVDVLEKVTAEAGVESIKQRAMARATQLAVSEGADPSTVQVVTVSEVPLTYLPGNVTRVMVKAVGDLQLTGNADTKTRSEEKVETANQSLQTPSAEPSSETTSAAQQTHEAAETAVAGAARQAPQSADADEREPCVDAQTGEWTLTAWDIECLAVGAGILGCGGGGSPYLGKLRLLKALEQGKRVRVLHPLRFARQSACKRALPLCYMGAPTVIAELLYAAVEVETAVTAMRHLYACGGYSDGTLRNTEGVEVVDEGTHSYIHDYKPPQQSAPQYPELVIGALMTDEIGGCNSMEPLWLGAQLDLPVLDCDAMGRAFPELQMTSHFMHGVTPAPTVLGNSAGRAAVCLSARDAKVLEEHFRTVCVDMGCSAAIVGPPLTTSEVTDKTVLYSMSRAWRLGRAVLSARAKKQSPVEAILEHERGTLLLTGKVVDVERKTTGGFARGQVALEGSGGQIGGESVDSRFLVLFQNEYLIVKDLGIDSQNAKVLATVPDLISLVDLDTGEPLASDEVRYGLRVAVLGLPAPPILTSPLALRTVGPQAFGYTGDEGVYRSLGQYVQHAPVPMP